MDCKVQNNIPLQLLEEITDGFSERRMIGFGSSGKVYKGVHKDGKKVAVKLLYGMPGLNDDQFQNEFEYLKRLDHQNIVRLVGCCNETKEKLVNHMGKLVLAEKRYTALCLEYMNNRSLDNYISDEHSGHSWSTRYKIIKGICEGLKYLHEELKPPIYHLDLKPANVLLDENMLPKIADFGLSRLFGEKQTQIISNDRGTDAYSPPEYKKGGIVSIKFDIFSLGVVIMKIMAGRTGYCRSHDISSEQFIELVHGNWRNRLQESRDMEIYSAQIKACIEIAVSCVEYDRNKRPKIGDIINKLNETEKNVLLKITKVSSLFSRATNVPRTLDSESAMELVSKRILVPKSSKNLVFKQTLKQNFGLESTEKIVSEGTIYIQESFSVATDEYSGHSWSTRYKIIKGICEGLKYLHEELKPPIYHLDLKPANVLLDENMLPKISDINLSKFFGEEQTQIISNDRETDAYSPPEYKKGDIVSMKFGTFSLGVVIIKIMAGRTGYCRSHDISSEQFIEHVHRNGRNRPTPAQDRRWSGKTRHMNSSSASSYTLMRNWKY